LSGHPCGDRRLDGRDARITWFCAIIVRAIVLARVLSLSECLPASCHCRAAVLIRQDTQRTIPSPIHLKSDTGVGMTVNEYLIENEALETLTLTLFLSQEFGWSQAP